MIESHEGIALVTIDGPGANLLNPGVMARVEHDLIAADREPGVTGIILTGAGEAFCGGLDVGAIRAGADPVEFAAALVSLLRLIPTLSTPVAAAVNGDAIASGASLVAACDYAVAIPRARIGTFEVSIGIWPMVAQVPIIKRIGARLAMENIGSGEPFTADRAREVGLVNRIADVPLLLSAVRDWLALSARGGAAVAAGRPSLYELAELSYDDALTASLVKFTAMF